MSLFTKCFSCAMRRMSLVLLPIVLLFEVLFAPAQIPPLSVSSVSVSGNEILINGSPGTLKGFTYVGITNPTTCASSFYSTAANVWGASELSYAQSNFNINVIRLQVALDLIYEPPTGGPYIDPSYIANYITSVGNAVALARSKGLAVIVSMQWESGASGTSVCDNDTPTKHHGATLTGNPATDNGVDAWSALLNSSAWTNNTSQGSAMDFNTDTGVLLEIYNEPSLGSIDGGAASWVSWQGGLQPLVNAIRSDGADNVLVIPGEAGEKILDATPYGGTSVADYMLTDSLNSLIYAVHPYPTTTKGTTYAVGYYSSQDWAYYFGNVAQTINAPVMITEWFTGGIDQSYCYDNITPQQPATLPWNYTKGTTFNSATIASELMSWLETAAPSGSNPSSSPMSIAGAWPFDAAGYNSQDLTNYDPTTFPLASSFQCNKKVTGTDGTNTYPGPGQDLANYFSSYLVGPISTTQISVTASGLAYSRVTKTFNGTITITNVSASTISGPFQVWFSGLPVGVSVVSPSGTFSGSPYLTVPGAASLTSGQSATFSVQFQNPSDVTISLTPAVYLGSI
jgi:Cellulase (glycosyl hydrolase family 5)